LGFPQDLTHRERASLPVGKFQPNCKALQFEAKTMSRALWGGIKKDI
jgi:hypothetical protein